MTVTPLPEIKSIPGLKRMYCGCDEDVQGYFEHLPHLLEYEFPLEVCLAYAFSRLESARRAALYCGVVKLHSVNTDLAKVAVATHMDNSAFISFYNHIFKTQPPSAAKKELETALQQAQDTRNDVLHGIGQSKEARSEYQHRLRNAIACALHCVEEINHQLKGKPFEIEPFGDLRGFAPSQKLDKRTSRFVLLGMGFQGL